MLITSVKDIIDADTDKVTVLKAVDPNGIRIPKTEILLSEIVKVHPLTAAENDRTLCDIIE